MNTHAKLSDLERKLNNIIRKGVIAEVSGKRARVQIGKIQTDWLPWACPRAGAVKVWSTPSVGEQCQVFSEGGNLAAGVIQLGIESDQNPAPESGENDLIIEVPEGGKLLLRCGASSIEVNSNNIKALSDRIDLNEG